MENHVLSQVSLQFQEGAQLQGDLSAIALTPDHCLWLGSDETTTIECLTPVDADTFENHQHFPLADLLNLPDKENTEIDIEGLDYTDYYLWVVGSHSTKRKKPKPEKPDLKGIRRLAKVTSEPNRYLLARIPLVDGKLHPSYRHPDHPEEQLTAAMLETTKHGNLLMEALVADPHLGAFIKAEIPSKDNGFDVEGIAVQQDKVFLGLRGPVLRGWAVILELAIAQTESTQLTLKPIGAEGELYKKHFVDLQGLGIRDLCLQGQDLLILAGPTMSLDGPVQVFRLENGANLEDNVLSQPEMIMDLPYGQGDHHAEGMALFTPVIREPSILVVYDSPAAATITEASGVLADVFKLD